MARRTQRDRIEAGANKLGDGARHAPLQHKRKRAWPERRGELPRSLGDDRIALGLLEAAYKDDQRVEAGPVFGREDLGNGIAVQSICAEAVNRFCRKRDDLAGSDGACSLADRLFAGFHNGHRGLR